MRQSLPIYNFILGHILFARIRVYLFPLLQGQQIYAFEDICWTCIPSLFLQAGISLPLVLTFPCSLHVFYFSSIVNISHYQCFPLSLPLNLEIGLQILANSEYEQNFYFPKIGHTVSTSLKISSHSRFLNNAISFCSVSLYYNTDKMPWELNSCFY